MVTPFSSITLASGLETISDCIPVPSSRGSLVPSSHVNLATEGEWNYSISHAERPPHQHASHRTYLVTTRSSSSPLLFLSGVFGVRVRKALFSSLSSSSSPARELEIPNAGKCDVHWSQERLHPDPLPIRPSWSTSFHGSFVFIS